MLVDQEENYDQSQSFEGDKDVLIGKEWQEVSQCNIYFKPISFFTTCLLLVGVMLSFTSEYQDITIARVVSGSDGSRGIYFRF